MSYVMICNSKDLGDPPPYKANDISCYHEVSDSLPVMNETALKGTSKNIFLIETSCKGYLDLRQACAVESAARAHPDWQVNLLFVGPVTRERLTTGILSSLQSYKNVVIARVYFSEIVKDTPLERLLSEKLLDKSEHRFAHTSDIIRLLLLWKFVGVYMDLDIVVIKPFDDLGLDFAGLEESTVRTGVMGLSNSFVGRKIASTAVL
ncbi:lactosylceramide 4-alpha-galactosyltransferase-like [Pectinophora gossypiella]|uniref:lactosylceramide 4-alpha-galactosyltransferase-like n=1 Tax=Pectinophora gossypiella TaxID=13191 RepID=UPI00214EC823|nr:lactosylceramide 4-alpha-galactosyltransferase-like [Pectinophora gossypiella]